MKFILRYYIDAKELYRTMICQVPTPLPYIMKINLLLYEQHVKFFFLTSSKGTQL